MTDLEQALEYVIKSVYALKDAHVSGTCAYTVSMKNAMERWKGKVKMDDLENAYTRWKRG